MFGATVSTTPLCFSSSTRFYVDKRTQPLNYVHSFSLFTPPSLHFSLNNTSKRNPHFFPKAASSSSSSAGN